MCWGDSGTVNSEHSCPQTHVGFVPSTLVTFTWGSCHFHPQLVCVHHHDLRTWTHSWTGCSVRLPREHVAQGGRPPCLTPSRCSAWPCLPPPPPGVSLRTCPSWVPFSGFPEIQTPLDCKRWEIKVSCPSHFLCQGGEMRAHPSIGAESSYELDLERQMVLLGRRLHAE